MRHSAVPIWNSTATQRNTLRQAFCLTLPSHNPNPEIALDGTAPSRAATQDVQQAQSRAFSNREGRLLARSFLSFQSTSMFNTVSHQSPAVVAPQVPVSPAPSHHSAEATTSEPASTVSPPPQHSRARFDATLLREVAGSTAAGSGDSILEMAAVSAPAVTSEAEVAAAAPRVLHPATRAVLDQVRREAEAVVRSSRKGRASITEFHQLLGRALGDEHTFAASRLHDRHVGFIRAQNRALQNFAELERHAAWALEQIDWLDQEEHGPRTKAEHAVRLGQGWSDQAKDAFRRKEFLSVGLAGLGMFGKNASWYGPKFIPAGDAPIGDVNAMAKLIAQRWAAANGGAATFEYMFAVLSQRLWVSSGNSLNTWQGIAQGWDMLAAAVLLKATGEKIHSNEVVGLAFSAFAVIAQTGMLNGLVERLYGACTGKRGDAAATPLFADAPEDEEAQQVEMAMPDGSQARSGAASIGHLLNAFPEAKREVQHAEFLEHADRIDRLIESINQLAPAAAPPVTEATAPHQALPAAEATEAAPAAAQEVAISIALMREILTQCRDDIGTLTAPVVAADAEHAAAQERGMDAIINTLTAVQADLKKAGGIDPAAAAFVSGLALMFVGGAVAGNVGPAVGSKILSNLNTRGVLNALASVVGQLFSNFGHLLWKDNPELGRRAQHLVGYLRAVSFTPSEFVLLQTGITLSEKGRELAGTIPEAPAGGWPSGPTVRILQELARAVLNPMFNKFLLGQDLRLQHIAGFLVAALGSAITIGIGLSARDAQHPMAGHS